MYRATRETTSGKAQWARWQSRAVTTVGRLASSPRSIAIAVFLIYGAWMFAVLLVHHSPYAFVRPGRHYVELAHQNGIRLPPLPSRYGGTAANPSPYGYDGQFTYYIALHPGSARTLLDVPWYRYQRILEPLFIRFVSLGSPTLVPWVMLAVSWIAVVGGTWALASWLAARGRNPAWSLLYGFWPGLMVTVRNDLTDGVAYGLVAAAVLLLDSPRRSRPVVSALIMSLAIFARQEVAIYGVAMAAGIAAGLLPPHRTRELPPLRNRLVTALRFEAIAIGPFCVYLLFLSNWLRSAPSQNSAPQGVPIPEKLADIFLLILPAVVASWAFRPSIRNPRSAHAWAWLTLFAHVLALTGFMIIGKSGVYYSWSFSTVFRYYIPVALGAVVCYGCVQGLTRKRSMVLAACCGLTMVAFPVLAGTGL
jgi:hypothetical protein